MDEKTFVYINSEVTTAWKMERKEEKIILLDVSKCI